MQERTVYGHWSKQLKDQPVLLLYSFVPKTSIKKRKKLKLRENTCYEKINSNLYYWSFGNNLQINTVEFFLKNYL